MSIKDKRIVFTGFRGADLKEKIENAGAKVVSDVSLLTDVLVAFPPDNITKKSEYLVHDNGGRPFRVTVTRDTFAVHKKRKLNKAEWNSNDWDTIWDGLPYDIEVVKRTKYFKIFIGKDKQSLIKPVEGSSVLVQLTKKKYMFIGWTIYTFEVEDDILGYYSMVGNSDVIYPYAVGENNTYLLIEDTYLPNELAYCVDPYTSFYALNKSGKHSKKYKIKKSMIAKRYDIN
jgi:hypothetical protein